MKQKLPLFLFATLIGFTACQPLPVVSEPVPPTVTATPAATASATPAPALTPNASATPTKEPRPTLAWEERNLTGKIVYVDRMANEIVIMDADGENAREISYSPGETYEPYLGSPVKWSSDGRKIAFGCQKLSPLDRKYFQERRGDGVRLSLCILDLVKNLQRQNNNISHGLHVIELPEQYTLDYSGSMDIIRRIFASLSWVIDGEALVLTPFCIIMVNATQVACRDWGSFDHLDDRNKELIGKAYFIAPSPVDEDIWALTVEKKILLMDLETGAVTEIDTEYENSSLYWSPDGNHLAILTNKTLYLMDVQTSSFEALMWIDRSYMKIEPELIIAYPGNAGYYGFHYYKNNIAWSQDSRNLILSIFIAYSSELFTGLFAGIYYFDLEQGEVFPVRKGREELGFPTEFLPEYKTHIVKFNELQLFTSPDWYACNDTENVCALFD